MVKSNNNRYGTVARILHWGILGLVAIIFVTGHFAGDSMDNAFKIFLLRFHVPLGMSVLLLTLFRIFWWWRLDKKPAPLDTTSVNQTRLAKIAHVFLYVLPLVMVGSGIGMMVLTGAGEELFFKDVGVLPDFTKVPPRFAHGIAAKVFMGIVVLHLAGALFHHFWLKDGTFKRMWFGG